MEKVLQALALHKGDSVKEKIEAFVAEKGWQKAIVTGALGSVVDVTVGMLRLRLSRPRLITLILKVHLRFSLFLRRSCEKG